MAGRLVLAPALLKMPLSSELSLPIQKCVVVNFSGLPNHTAQRMVLGGTGLACRVAIGPESDDIFWRKGLAKFHICIAQVRDTPGPARERLNAYMMFDCGPSPWTRSRTPPRPSCGLARAPGMRIRDTIANGAHDPEALLMPRVFR